MLPHAAHVVLAVYDVTGRRVCVLVDGIRSGGEQRVVWNAASVGSGVYFVRLAVGDVGVTRKVVLVR